MERARTSLLPPVQERTRRSAAEAAQHEPVPDFIPLQVVMNSWQRRTEGYGSRRVSRSGSR